MMRAENVVNGTDRFVREKDLPSSDLEVKPKKPRRRLTAGYKLRVLEEADKCKGPGEVGALLRREGLYSSSLSAWRKQRAQGALGALSEKRGRKPKEANPLEQEVVKLNREKARLESKLKQAEAIIEAQKKISEILGIEQPSEEEILGKN